MDKTWAPYANSMQWVLYTKQDDGYLVRDTRENKTYQAKNMDEVHEIAADLSQLANYYGAGDLVHQLAQHIGVERCSKCAKRHTFLNRMFPMLWPKR